MTTSKTTPTPPSNPSTLSLPSRQSRAFDSLRQVKITRGYTVHAEGSVLIEFGLTKVLCTASVEEKVPGHKKGSGEGWVTAEYGMLPRSTHTRSDREAARGKQSGRTQEIQRRCCLTHCIRQNHRNSSHSKCGCNICWNATRASIA